MISGIKRYCQNMAILNINEVHLLNKDKKKWISYGMGWVSFSRVNLMLQRNLKRHTENSPWSWLGKEKILYNS